MRDRFRDLSRPQRLSSGPQEIALGDARAPKDLPSTPPAYALANPAPDQAPARQIKVASAAKAPMVQPPAQSQVDQAQVAQAQVAQAQVAQAPMVLSPVVQASASSTDKPFYKKVFGGV